MSKLSQCVAVAAVAGAAAIADAVWQWHSASLPATLAYFALSLLASAVKLRVPGVAGTLSLGFVPVLVGVALMSLSETVLVVSCAAVVQRLWRATGRPRADQLLFNSGTLAFAAWTTYRLTHALAPELGPWQAFIAALPLYLLNATAMAIVLSIASTDSLSALWGRFQLTVFPYYVVGAALAALIAHARLVYPGTPLLAAFALLTYLTFNSYRRGVRRLDTV